MPTLREFPLLSDVLVRVNLADPTDDSAVTGATVTYDVVNDQRSSYGITGSVTEVGSGEYRATIESTATTSLREGQTGFVKITAVSSTLNATTFLPIETVYDMP